MKILIISTTVFPIPLQGYGGLEQLAYLLAVGLAQKGHQVTVVAPEGSRLPPEIELIPTAPREDEEKAWARYRGRLEAGEWEVILDASWGRWAMMSSAGRDPQLPIINWHHTDPSVYGSTPPVQYPMWVGLSKSHAENLSRHLGVPVKFVYNGIDTEFYKANGKPRGSRYAWVARYTPEKGAAEIIELAQKLRVGVDMFGDLEIIGNPGYAQMCLSRADGLFARVSGGISREAVVDVLSTHAGLLQWSNWQEPFSLVIPEAMACGCPVIANRRGAMPELVVHGVPGFIVDSLAELAALIAQGEVKKLNPDQIRKHVEKKFSLQVFVDAWEKLLTEVASGAARW